MKNFIFKYRGWLFVPAAIIMLILAKPTFLSMAVGFFVSFFIGEGIRIWAVGFSGTTTRSNELEAPKLTTAGLYAHLRNPLYLGNLVSWLGFCVAAAGSAPLLHVVIIFASMLLSYLVIYGNIIPLEEEFLKKTFGEEYKNYFASVPRMIPSFSPYKNKSGVWDPKVIINAEIQTIIMLIIVAVLLVLKY